VTEDSVPKPKSKTEDATQAKTLESLRKALDGAPHRLQASGQKTPGLFPGGKAGATLANKALEAGLLELTPSPENHKGKGKQPPRFVRITERGRRFALDGGDLATLLTSLGESLAAREADLAGSVRRIGEQFQAWREQLEETQQALHARFADHQQASQTLRAVLDRSHRPGEPHPAAQPKPLADDWLDEAVRIVTDQKQQNPFERLTLPRIYEQVRKIRPDLTLGGFHDGLRLLQEQRRLRLTGFTQALATLPDAQNALYLDREVKFYVDLP
jgi:hypothetical protein